MTAEIPRAMVTASEVLRLPQDMKGSHWWVLQTSTRLTSRISDALRAIGATPVNLVKLVTTPRINGNGKTYKHTSERRLLPNYVFVNGTESQVWEPRRPGVLYSVTEIKDQCNSALQLSRVVELSNAGVDLTVETYAPGRRVKVTSGYLMGYEGTVIEHRPKEIRFALAETGKEIVIDLRAGNVEAL